MYSYLLHVKEKKNEIAVSNILQPILDDDIISVQAVKENLDKLEQLKEIGETEVYDRVRQDLKELPVYRDIIL